MTGAVGLGIVEFSEGVGKLETVVFRIVTGVVDATPEKFLSPPLGMIVTV